MQNLAARNVPLPTEAHSLKRGMMYWWQQFGAIHADKIPEVDDFIKQNTSYMYSGSCKSKPNFCYDEGSGTLYRLSSEGRREVVHANRAREIINNIHRPQGRACRKDGINAIVKCFSQQYDCKGVRKIVQDVKANCDGTCKRMAALKTRKPPPKLIRSFRVMERIQIDLLHGDVWLTESIC